MSCDDASRIVTLPHYVPATFLHWVIYSRLFTFRCYLTLTSDFGGGVIVIVYVTILLLLNVLLLLLLL